jgi:hypothetical protein
MPVQTNPKPKQPQAKPAQENTNQHKPAAATPHTSTPIQTRLQWPSNQPVFASLNQPARTNPETHKSINPFINTTLHHPSINVYLQPIHPSAINEHIRSIIKRQSHPAAKFPSS